MHIGSFGIEFFPGNIRNIGEAVGLGGGYLPYIPVFQGFLVCFSGKLAGNNIIRRAAFGQQIQGNRCEDLRGSSLHEENLVIVGNVHHPAQCRLGILDDLIVNRGPMAHFHHRHSGTFVVKHLVSAFLQNLHREHRRTC